MADPCHVSSWRSRLLPVRPCNWHAGAMEDLDIQCLRRSALIAQGIEHRFPKPCVAGSNPAGGTVREWPILPPPAQTAPSHLSVSYPGCPRHAGLYCSLMHANCTAAVLAASPGCVSGTANQGPWARGLSRGPRVFHALGRPHVAPGRGSNEQAEGDQGTRGPFGHPSVTTSCWRTRT